MSTLPQPGRHSSSQRPIAFWHRRWVRVFALSSLTIAILFAAASVYIALHVQPLVKARLLTALRQRFNSPVELDSLDVSLLHGMSIEGRGLRIAYLSNPGQPDTRSPQEQAHPMLSIDRFEIHGSFHQLTEPTPRISSVLLDGVELHIPNRSSTPEQRAYVAQHPVHPLLIDHFRCRNLRIIVEPDRPGRGPAIGDVPTLDLIGVGPNHPFHFDAIFLLPKPRATYHASGSMGPWFGPAPRETPLDGTYSFDDMDLGTIHGIGGRLVSHAAFTGSLGHLTLDGISTSRNFSLDVSSHPMPLTARFHAEVDAPSGDTHLFPVIARLGQTNFTVTGTVVRVQPGPGHPQGHDISLNVSIPNGRIEDLLALGMKTSPPVMRGAATVQARVHIPPGPERVPAKMQLAGTLNLHAITFTNTSLQARIDDTSARAQGHPRDSHSAAPLPEVDSQMFIDFSIAHALLTASKVHYEAPGMNADLDGAYSLDGTLFDFRGRVRSRASPSQMVTGWKSWLLKGLDPFTKKGDFGIVVPIELSGAKNDVKVGIPTHGVDDSAQQIATQMKSQPRASPPTPSRR